LTEKRKKEEPTKPVKKPSAEEQIDMREARKRDDEKEPRIRRRR
jgi:hypothetical protein